MSRIPFCVIAADGAGQLSTLPWKQRRVVPRPAYDAMLEQMYVQMSMTMSKSVGALMAPIIMNRAPAALKKHGLSI